MFLNGANLRLNITIQDDITLKCSQSLAQQNYCFFSVIFLFFSAIHKRAQVFSIDFICHGSAIYRQPA